MNKINFENLPSTNTPLNADNLNDMQSNIEKSVVAIGKTQPSTNENVWIKKGKNLFDKNNVLNGYRFSSDGALYADSDFSATDYIEVNSGTQYTVSWAIQIVQCVCYYDENKNFISRNGSEKTFTTPANCRYIRASVATANINSAQIEQGTQTTYEPYVEKEIFVKNDNGVFEKFYSEKLANGWKNAIFTQYVGGAIIYTQIGNLVIVQFDDLKVLQNITEHGTVLATGLPKSNKYIRTELVSYNNPIKPFRIAIDENGNIINHYCNVNADNSVNFYGSLMYLVD